MTNKCSERGMHGLLTATIGNVEAIVPATSLSASFDDWSLYGITEGTQLVSNAQEYCPDRNIILRSSLRISFFEAITNQKLVADAGVNKMAGPRIIV